MALQIRVDLVSGTYLPDYSMSMSEFSYRIIGDDHGPPALAWSLSFATDDGQVSSLYFDPKDNRSEIQIRPVFEAALEESEAPSYKQERLEIMADAMISQLRELVSELHSSQKETIGAKVDSITGSKPFRQSRSYIATKISRFVRIKRFVEPDLSVIDRVQSQNKNIAYSDPVVIHKTRQSTIKAIPYTVKRSVMNDCKLKLELSTAKGPTDAITLDDKAMDLLRAVIDRYAPVMKEKHDGKYAAVPLSSSAVMPEHIADSTQSTVKFQELLNDPDLLAQVRDGRIEIRKAVQLASHLSQLSQAIDELKLFLSSGEDRESAYQEWIKLHSWIFGAEYYEADSERGLTAHDSVDAYLPKCINGFREILELKIPSMPVLIWDKKHRNYYLAAPVSQAIGQVHRYLENFSKYADNGLSDSPEIIAHHPCATIVIGRSNQWNDDMHRSLHGLNARISGIQVITFDHLVSRGERMLEIVGKTATECDSNIGLAS